MGALDAARFAMRTIAGLHPDASGRERRDALDAAREDAGSKIASPVAAERAQALTIQKEALADMLAKRREALKAELAAAETAHAEAVAAAELAAEQARQKLDTAIAKDIKARLRPVVAKWVESGHRNDLRAIAETWAELDARAHEQLGEPVREEHLELAIVAAHGADLACWFTPGAFEGLPRGGGPNFPRQFTDATIAQLTHGANPILVEEHMRNLERAVVGHMSASVSADPEILAAYETATASAPKVREIWTARTLAKEEARFADAAVMPRGPVYGNRGLLPVRDEGLADVSRRDTLQPDRGDKKPRKAS